MDASNPNFSASGGMLMNKTGTTLIAWPSASGSVTLTGITTIGDSAFTGCDSLASVTLPVATDIGQGAFTGCTSLNNLTFGKDTAPWPVLAGNVFRGTGTGSLTIHVPSGTESNYTGTWGVSASVSAGNTYSSVYGGDHKAITIVGY
ncbi:MAG: leucine-rich repeat domain-containing protein [Treponema sp.]|nr:leucine-rich repeat domain-containing protein [Treponema sp.]